MDNDKYRTILSIPIMVGGKKVKALYVRVRAARPAEKPSLLLPIPREIADQLDIQVGETFAVFVDGEDTIKLVRPKI